MPPVLSEVKVLPWGAIGLNGRLASFRKSNGKSVVCGNEEGQISDSLVVRRGKVLKNKIKEKNLFEWEEDNKLSTKDLDGKSCLFKHIDKAQRTVKIHT